MEGRSKNRRFEIISMAAVRRFTRAFYVLIFAFLFLAPSVFAQVTDDQEIAPPPLKLLSKEERSQLQSEDEVKKRTKLALDLMNQRLAQSEILSSRKEYDEMFKQLGSFHGLVDDTLQFLGRGDKNSGKTLNNFKRLELGLRTFSPRLELIRRDLPMRYEAYLRILIKYLRDARTKAVEPLFSDTVVPNRKT